MKNNSESANKPCTKVKKVLLISDGKAGHEAVSFGLIDGIEKEYDLEVTIVSASMRLRFLKSLFSVVLNRVSSIKIKNLLCSIFYSKFDLSFANQYHLIISTGGMTAYYNVIAGALLGVPNLYMSSLRGIAPHHFSYIVSIDPLSYPNAINVELAPTRYKIDESSVAQFIKKNNIENVDIWGVLIGGSTNEYPWNESDIEQFLNLLMLSAESAGVKLIVSTSRRSGENVEKMIKRLEKTRPDVFAYIVYFGQNPEKISTTIMRVSKKLFVTEDSGSMITEGILSKTPLFTLRREGAGLSGGYAETVQRNINRGYIKSICFNNVNKTMLGESGFNLLTQNSSQQIVELLKPILDKDV